MALIDAHRDRWGVEPICQMLEVAPSTYYAATSRPDGATDNLPPAEFERRWWDRAGAQVA